MRCEKDDQAAVERLQTVAEFETRVHSVAQGWPWGEQLFTDEVMRQNTKCRLAESDKESEVE